MHSRCRHPLYLNPVDGSGGSYCDILRMNEHLCGREGRHFEPRVSNAMESR